MKKFIFSVMLMLMFSSAIYSMPALQLYIDGATFDRNTHTWTTSASSFNLYVIGRGPRTDVTLSMALDGVGQTEDPSGSAVTIDGVGFPTSSWTHGYAPLSNDPNTYDGFGSDLPKHRIFPAWFTEFGLGSFSNQGQIGNVNPYASAFFGDQYWNPTQGYIDPLSTDRRTQAGWFQSYSINVTGGQAVHFDAYTLDDNGEVDRFTPFWADAQGGGGGSEIPEPATMLLFGMGLAGTGLVKRFRKK